MSELAKCRTCHKEVSQTAITCPHCGESSPASIEEKKEEITICSSCKEKVKKGAWTCPHCRANLFWQEYPTIANGSLAGGLIGAAIIWFNIQSQGRYDFDVLIKAAIGGYFYPLIGGFIGGFIGAVVNALGWNKMVFKGKKATMVFLIILLIPTAFLALLSWYPSPSSQDISGIPKSVEDYKKRGDDFVSRGNIDSAISDYSKAIEINPKDGEAYNNRAVMYVSKGEYAKAKEDVSKAQALGYGVSQQLIENLAVAGISLDGIFVDANGKYKAMMNGNPISEGDNIGDVKINKINKDSVDIIVNGQMRNIKVSREHI